MRLRNRGIFCLEGDWNHDLKRPSSVEPILSVIDQQLTRKRPHIHRDIGTVQELEYYLDKWTQKQYSGYPILYLGFHGEKGVIRVGDGRKGTSKIDLDWLGERLAGACDRRFIHLGSCSTLGLHGSTINRFRKTTGALAVSGYERDIDWIESAAFELLLLTEFQFHALTPNGALKMKAAIESNAGGLQKKLSFRMVVKPNDV